MLILFVVYEIYREDSKPVCAVSKVGRKRPRGLTLRTSDQQQHGDILAILFDVPKLYFCKLMGIDPGGKHNCVLMEKNDSP